MLNLRRYIIISPTLWLRWSWLSSAIALCNDWKSGRNFEKLLQLKPAVRLKSFSGKALQEREPTKLQWLLQWQNTWPNKKTQGSQTQMRNTWLIVGPAFPFLSVQIQRVLIETVVFIITAYSSNELALCWLLLTHELVSDLEPLASNKQTEKK